MLLKMALAAAFVVAAMVDARAQVASNATATIMTDGVVEPNGQATLAINELAEVLGRTAKIRVLPVAGLGGASSVRELLYLPGIDLAILNSDVFAYLDLNKQLPEARRRIRHVVQLYEQQLYLLARKPLNTLADLKGRRVLALAAGGGGHVTAATVFGLQGLPVTLETLQPGQLLEDASVGGFDGIALLSGEFPRVRLSDSMRQDFHLIPIPITPALQKAYRATSIEERDRAGFAAPGKVETVAVSTSLASFDWKAGQYRHTNVTNFIQAMFATLPALRKQNPSSFWGQVALETLPPGWTHYAFARPRDVLKPAQITELAKLERPPVAPRQPLATEAKQAPPAKRSLTLLAAARPPLADERLPSGGLVGSLVRQSLALGMRENGPSEAPLEIKTNWTRAVPTPVETILNDRSIDLSFPFESPDCDRPNDLAQRSAVLCDTVVFSDPLIQVVVGLFHLSGEPFPFETDEKIFGKTLCVPQDRDVSNLNSHGRNWLTEKRVTLLRPATLLECLSIVQKREAHAFIASDLEARYSIDMLGLASQFSMVERPLGMHSLHAVVSQNHARAGEIMTGLNEGLRQLKKNGTYASVVREHLSRLWTARTGTP